MVKTETFYVNDEKTAFVKAYLWNEGCMVASPRKSVVVCPGGGYWGLSDREAEPIAMEYFAKGYSVFIMNYTVGENCKYPKPVVEISLALKYIREHAEEWHLDKDAIAVCGFSAGGHLACSIGVHWNNPIIKERSGCFNGENKPNAMILIYPVISSSWAERKDGRINGFLHDETLDYEEFYKMFNLHLHVTKDTPPAFIAHTFRDNCVPVEDSLNLAQSMTKAQIPYELHIFPNGWHGLSLGTKALNGGYEDRSFKEWLPLSLLWLERLLDNKEEANAPINKAEYLSRY